jgi:hypothetical protein
MENDIDSAVNKSGNAKFLKAAPSFRDSESSASQSIAFSGSLLKTGGVQACSYFGE